MLKNKLKWLNLFLAALTVLVIIIWRQRPDGNLKVVFCDVGQGDATLIIWRDQQVLVDGGPNNRVLDCLGKQLPFYDRTIELMIASHAEADHITGLVETARRYRVGRFLAVKEVNDSPEYRALAAVLAETNVAVEEMVRGAGAEIGPLRLVWLWPEGPGGDSLAWSAGSGSKVLGVKTSLNQYSQVIAASFGDFDLLLTGDIDSKTEVKLSGLADIEVLKVAHHGSKYSSSAEFLAAVRPELAVIEVGKNSYGHPTKEVIDRLSRFGAKVRRTDKDGDVVVVSDGRNWQVLE